MNILYIFLGLILSIAAHAETTKSRGNSFNPDIGVNLLFLSQDSSRDNAVDGLRLQETEIQFSSDVDTYFTAKALFSVAQENGEYGIEPEEAYVETTSIPYAIIRAGKSKMPIGKHNQLHSHAFPFINPPLVNEVLLGEEGLNETGIGVSALIPFSWFSEFTIDYTQGENENLFNSDIKSDKAFIGRFKNLWDLSDSLTLELGLSQAQGKNSDHLDTSLYGADLTLKWRPVDGGKYHSFEWSSEYLEKDRKGAVDGQLAGIVTYLKYQMAQRWYAQYRYDELGFNKANAANKSKRNTFLVAFIPSEFSGIRLQYESIDDNQPEVDNKISLQLNISIGAHPAHSY